MKRVMDWFWPAVLFAAFILISPRADAVQLDAEGCLSYAVWSSDVIWARDAGADREKVRASFKKMQADTDHPIFTLLLRDLNGLWATAADRNTVASVIYKDCLQRRGKYGEGT